MEPRRWLERWPCGTVWSSMIQALPVLRLLKLHRPDAEIFWWIDSGLAPLLEGDPDLAGVIRFERKRWAKPEYWPEMFQSVREMRAQGTCHLGMQRHVVETGGAGLKHVDAARSQSRPNVAEHLTIEKRERRGIRKRLGDIGNHRAVRTAIVLCCSLLGAACAGQSSSTERV